MGTVFLWVAFGMFGLILAWDVLRRWLASDEDNRRIGRRMVALEERIREMEIREQERQEQYKQFISKVNAPKAIGAGPFSRRG